MQTVAQSREKVFFLILALSDFFLIYETLLHIHHNIIISRIKNNGTLEGLLTILN